MYVTFVSGFMAAPNIAVGALPPPKSAAKILGHVSSISFVMSGTNASTHFG